MALKGFIGSTELDLPDDFTLPAELHSPIYDFKEFRVGDLTIGVAFPLTPQNRLAFQFSGELAVASKTLKYEDFRLEEDGEIRMVGILTLKNSESVEDEGSYDCDFYTNLLGIDVANEKVSTVLTKTLNLGSTTAAITAAAKAQNAAAMSTDGTAGAVMKFVPHFNPDFYGEANPDFYPDTSEHSKTSTYERGAFVTQRLAENDAQRQNNTNYTFVGLVDYTPPDEILEPIPFDVFTNDFDQGLFDTDRLIFTEEKRHKIRMTARVRNDNGSTTHTIVFTLRTALSAGTGIAVKTVFIKPGEKTVVALQEYFDAVAADEIIATTTTSNGGDIVIESANLEVIEVNKFSAQPLMRFTALDKISTRTTRENSPYWELDSAGIINDYDSVSVGGFFRQNGVKLRINGDLFPVNRHSLVPFLQLHAVIYSLSEALGYRVKGEFMQDTLEQRALIASNYALDKSSGREVYTFVGIEDYEVPDGILLRIPFNRFSGIFTNANLAWDTSENWFTAEFDGWHKITFRSSWINLTGSDNRPLFSLRRSDTSGDLYWVGTDEPTVESEEVGDTLVEVFFELTAGDHVYATTTGISVPFEIIFAELEVTHLEKDDLNIFNGTVDFANHVPDVSVAEFFLTLQLTKNLFISFDVKSKIIYLDYTDNIIGKSKGEMEASLYVTTRKRLEQKPKKRFAMNYAVLPEDTWAPDSSYEQLDPVTHYTELSAPVNTEQAVLVQNEQAWYVSIFDQNARIFQWQRKGSNYPDLKVEEEGDELYEIRPNIGPVQMGLVCNHNRHIALMPILSGKGQSTMFKPDGERLPFQVLYWVGLDSSITGGYPLATTTKYNSSGTEVLARDMSWLTTLNQFWKRTLQMLVLEEITRNYYQFPPEKKQLINFARIFLLGHVPVIPIKTAELIGGKALMEIQARKVKSVEVTVVGDVVEIDEGGETPGGEYRYLADEVTDLTLCFSHLLCKESYAGNPWGQVNSANQAFDSDNFAILPNEALDTGLAFYNQVNGALDQSTSGGYSGDADDFARSCRVGDVGVNNSDDAFTYICVFKYPVSTRTGSQIMFEVGGVAGSNGGARMLIDTTGRIEIRIRRGNTIWEKFDGALNDDDLHIIAWTYDGSLNRSGMSLYLDDMTTPLTPTTTSGSSISLGAYLVRQRYLCKSGSVADGLKQDFHLANSALTNTDLETVKEILEQYYTFS